MVRRSRDLASNHSDGQRQVLQDDEDCGLLGLAHMGPPEFSVGLFLTAMASNSPVGGSDPLAEECRGTPFDSASWADQASARLLPEEKLLPSREPWAAEPLERN